LHCRTGKSPIGASVSATRDTEFADAIRQDRTVTHDLSRGSGSGSAPISGRDPAVILSRGNNDAHRPVLIPAGDVPAP